MNIETARFNMIEQQIRPWDVLDSTVLRVLRELPRERFVPAAHQNLAFADIEVPLGFGERMWQPKLEARVVQDLDLKANERVLDIGTGSGYLAALLGRLSKQVVSVERVSELHSAARERLREFSPNVECVLADGAEGWAARGPFDVIVFGGSLPVLSERLTKALVAQLTDTGRVFAVVGNAPVMKATVFQRQGEVLRAKVLFETVLSPLTGSPSARAFSF